MAKRVSILSPYPEQEAALMFQVNEETPSCIILIKIENKKISQMDICMPQLFKYRYK